MTCKKSLQELWIEKFSEDWGKFRNEYSDKFALAVDSVFGFGAAELAEKELIGALGKRLILPLNILVDFVISDEKQPDIIGVLVSNATGTLITEGTAFLAESAAVAEFAPLVAAAAALLPEAVTIAIGVAGAFLAGLAAKSLAEATEIYNDQSSKAPETFDLSNPSVASGFPKPPTEGVTAYLGTYQEADEKRRAGILLSTTGLITGTALLDKEIGCVEQVILTKFADVLDVGKTNLKDYQGYQFTGLYNVTVDMANPYGGNIRVSDYDTVDYSGDVRSGTVLTPIPGYAPHLTLGVYWHDGATQAGFFNFIDGAADYAGAFSVPALYAALKTEDALFPDDTLHVKGTENITLTNQDDRFYFSGTDYTIHSGVGRIDAGAGDDKILYYGGKHYNPGDIVDQAAHDDAVAQWSAYNAQTLAYAKAQAVHAAWVAAGSNGTAPTIPPVPVKPTVDINAGVAQQDLSLTLDGGTGNDWVLAIGGTKVTTAGGLGRDWLYNTSAGGKIWGDVANSILDVNASGGHYDQRYYITTSVDAQGVSHATRNYIADAPANADVIWWSGGTVLEDAQRNDVLKFFGIPLVGGSDSGGVAFSLIGAASGFTSAGVAGGKAQQGDSYTKTLYTDEFLPFITYQFVKGDNGQYDLKVGNVVTAFVDAFEAATNLHTGLSKLLPQFFGTMLIKDFVNAKQAASGGFPVTYRGIDQFALTGLSKLNLVFKKENPIFEILAHLPPTLITFAASGGGPLVDEAFTAAAAADRFAKALNWSTGADHLFLLPSRRCNIGIAAANDNWVQLGEVA